ncbi:MAG: hypothetical protein AAGJ86_00990 [Pseudomonadota bacterium]
MLFGLWKLTIEPSNYFWWICTGVGLLIMLRPGHIGNGRNRVEVFFDADGDGDD